jgi:hypothetical protein
MVVIGIGSDATVARSGDGAGVTIDTTTIPGHRLLQYESRIVNWVRVRSKRTAHDRTRQ